MYYSPIKMLIYQIFIPSFSDSNNDGIGDFRGIINKLPHLIKLNIKGILLSPFNPSPSYHKYDIKDYYSIDEQFGSISDLQELINLAHDHDIIIIMDLVINHTSTQHPWFVEACKNEDNLFHNHYIWKHSSDISQLEKETIEADSDNQIVWHATPSLDKKYYSYFYSGMPQLNYDNPQIRTEAKSIAEFWLNQGIDGFRIDAAKHIYEHSGKIDKTISWWEEFNSEIKKYKSNALIFGEVWDSIELQHQFSKGFDALFNFEWSGILIDCLKKKEGQRFAKEWCRIQNFFNLNNFTNTLFLTNHDQNRIRSQVRNDYQIKIASFLMLVTSGYKFIYQGEELGMRGEKPDEHIRECINWADGSNCTWITPKYQHHSASIPNQEKDKSSILNFYRKISQLNLKFTKGKVIPLAYKEVFAIQDDVNFILINFSRKSIPLNKPYKKVLQPFEIWTSKKSINRTNLINCIFDLKT